MTMRRVVALVTAILVLQLTVPVLFLNSSTGAIQVANRSVEIADPTVSVTTTHVIRLDIMSVDAIGSMEFEYCSNDPLPGLPCTPPADFDVSAAILSAESGESGFAIHPNTTVNRLVIARAPIAPTLGASAYTFDSVVNASTAGSNYIRVATFGTNDGTGPRIDEGGIAYSLVSGFSVSAYVPPWLLFCTGSVIPTDCASATGSGVGLGTFLETSTATGTSQMQIATNGEFGYRIFVLGTTMTSGNNVIPGKLIRSGLNTGVSEFGINLRSNSSPSVGSDPAGPGTANPTSDYNVSNQFKFVSGDTLAIVGTTNDTRTYTVSYAVNVDDAQKAGFYSTTLSYVALASF